MNTVLKFQEYEQIKNDISTIQQTDLRRIDKNYWPKARYLAINGIDINSGCWTLAEMYIITTRALPPAWMLPEKRKTFHNYLVGKRGKIHDLTLCRLFKIIVGTKSKILSSSRKYKLYMNQVSLNV